MSAMPTPTLGRTTFRTSRLLDFCSRKELVAQTGHREDQWPLVALKELVDNALDACEDAAVAPVVTVTVDEDGIEVADNGLGLQGSQPEDQLLTHAATTLRRNGATPADVAFLQRNQRVEPNMLTSDQLVELVEAKLTTMGITKVVPDPDVFTSAFRRAWQIGILNRTLAAAAAAARRQAAEIDLPDHLFHRVREYLQEHSEEPWDTAVAGLVEDVLPGAGPADGSSRAPPE
jgi:hypothetical protein